MVGVGIVGLGFMGMIHYLAYRKVAGARVAALCSRDPAKLAGDWTGIQGNFGPRGTWMDLSSHARYAAFDALLADPAVELVDLCVPNDEHAPMALRALEAGKHVLVEKPIALTVADADRMRAAARQRGRLLMVAHVLPYFPAFAYAVEAVRSGRCGRLQAAHLTRVITRPEWSRGIADLARSGGPAIDLHIHDTHFVALLCGPPRAVVCRGLVADGAVVHLSTHYLYDEPVVVGAISGALSQSGRPFTHGFEIYLERATLSYASTNLAGTAPLVQPLTVILPEGRHERPDLGSGDPIDAFAAELTAAVAGVAAEAEPHALSSGLARQALALCQAEVESVQTGRTVTLDAGP